MAPNFDLSTEEMVPTISPNDLMYKGLTDPMLYFVWAHAALKSIKLAMLAAEQDDCGRILDLPCGHGRVLRGLRGAFPEAEIVACDISRDAVDFCAEAFGATPVYAEEDPSRIAIEGEFDLIWCGSLLTHLNDDRWVGFLDLFESLLAPGGLLIFTTHGRRVAQLLREGTMTISPGPEVVARLLDEFEAQGFAYERTRQDIDYGWSLSAPSWVCGHVENRPGLRLLNYVEMGWNNHQDAVSCVRPRPRGRVGAVSGPRTGSSHNSAREAPEGWQSGRMRRS